MHPDGTAGQPAKTGLHGGGKDAEPLPEIHRQTTPADDMHRIEGQVHQHQKGKQDVVEKHHGSRKF